MNTLLHDNQGKWRHFLFLFLHILSISIKGPISCFSSLHEFALHLYKKIKFLYLYVFYIQMYYVL